MAEVPERSHAEPTSDSSTVANGNRWEQMAAGPAWRTQPLRAFWWWGRWLIGAGWLVAWLTAIGSIPGGNLFVLGYLLDVQGRVARGARLLEAFPGIPAASRAGGVLIGLAIVLLPLRLFAEGVADARAVSPGSLLAKIMTGALVILAGLIAVHLVAALLAGGSLGRFFRPLDNLRRLSGTGGWRRPEGEDWRAFVAVGRVPSRLLVGATAYLATQVWLAVPIGLILVVDRLAPPWRQLAGLVGGALLVPLLLWLPFLQVQFAEQRKLRAMFAVGTVRHRYGHAPLAWAAATLVLFAMTLPLLYYQALARMRLPPVPFVWDVVLISLLTTWPARLATAYAYRRAGRRAPAGWLAVWGGRLVLVVAASGFAYLLFHTRLIGGSGRSHLLEFHPFVMPLAP